MPVPPAPALTATPGSAAHWEGHMCDDVAATYGPSPCAALDALPDALHLRGNRGNFLVPRDRIRRITRGRLYPWFFGGLRIEHDMPGLPRDLQFLPLGGSAAAIRHDLRRLGYPA